MLQLEYGLTRICKIYSSKRHLTTRLDILSGISLSSEIPIVKNRISQNSNQKRKYFWHFDSWNFSKIQKFRPSWKPDDRKIRIDWSWL